MKHLKKIMSLLLTAIMVIAMCVPVMAADSTPVDVSKHTFNAYQIFSGVWNAENSKLENIEWGNGVKTTELLTDLKTNNAYENCDSAAAVAAVVSGYGIDSQEARAFAATVAKHIADDPSAKNIKNGDKIDAGYYLIVDITDTNGETDAKNLSLLSVGTTVTVTSKNSYPTVTKKVQDINDSTDTNPGELQDSADYDIGDLVPFTLTGTLPNDYASYKSYKYVFHDIQSAGLDAPENIKVTVDGTELATTAYKVVTSNLTDGCTFEIIISDLKKVAPDAKATSKVVVTYNSKLNNNAVRGAMGNPNKVYLEYSNNPNAGGEGDTGKTPEDKVIIFTYEVIVNKYKNEVKNGNELAGAQFTLEKVKNTITGETPIWEPVKDYTVSKDAENIFRFTGLDDGTYRLRETVTPTGYNTIEPIIFTVTGTHTTIWEDQQPNEILTDLGAMTTTDSKTNATFTSNTTDGKLNGSLTTNVVNKSGSTLPTTGGIGTTIFYVVGVVLMLGAGVLLITKRRMSAKH